MTNKCNVTTTTHSNQEVMMRPKRVFPLLFALLLCVSLFSEVSVFATEGGAAVATGDALWNTVSDLIGTWVTRLGAVVMFVGGIMFGLGWKNDDAEGKSRGISTLISGAIVTAIAALTGTFFA